MNREFYADRPNEKWLTDVTAFKYYDGPVIKKLYRSAFLDLYDRRIVAYKPVVLGYLIYQTVSGKLSSAQKLNMPWEICLTRFLGLHILDIQFSSQ